MADSVASKKKRRLKDMDADDFMEYGLDSDLSLESEEDEENGTEKTAEKAPENVKSKTSKHKMQLSKLEEKDPEFYKFLKENDQELLQFNDSDTDEEIEESTDEEDENDDTAPKGETEQDNQSDAEVEPEDEDEQPQKKGKHVTMEIIKQWRKELEKMSLHGLHQVIKAFRAAVHGALDEVSTDNKTPMHFVYRVEGNAVFNAIIQLCLKHVYTVLHHHIGGSSTKHGKVTLPSSNKKWNQVKTSLKFYLTDLLQLLRTLAEPSMLCVILKHANQLSVFFACYPKISKNYIKRMTRMWGTGNEHVRVMAFLGLNKIMALLPSPLIEFCLKQLYLGFVKNTKFTSPRTLPLITFMQNSLVEVFRLDPQLTYQHAFVYIRQLAIHLRNAIVNKKKDSFQSVYNWQYVHCIHLWCRVLSEIQCQGVLDPLIYPLVQVVLGVIKLLPTARYYPLRFHCIRSLNLLSKTKDTYIPIAPFLLQILDAEFKKKIKMSTAKPLDFSCILKVSKSALHTKPFEDAVMDNIFELLLEFFSVHAHSIAFPEIALPTVITLRKFIKTTHVPKYRKQIKQLLDKIEETSTEVTERRSNVSFSPKDIKEVESWTAQYKQHPNTIVKFYSTWKTMKPVTTPPQNDEADDDHDESGSEEDEEPKTKRQKKSRKEGGKIDNKQKKSQQKKENISRQTNEEMPDVEDIVEDFHFSSDEDN
ncbi:nucleolar complex protein 2 homolog [Actinia tenebrosa]|uniref:Nucleolar complex protein 2 homolog n=1 Tax=Actinia tenebrosa TaxID=6105 RepID=A0A6P8HDW6_ACTTE|nr:nucleolar complex protein 2 homolog [Actinia tenebrosa]